MSARMTAAEYRSRFVYATSEDAFRQAVQQLAKARGWLVYHPITSTLGESHVTAYEGDAGYWDTTFVRSGVMLCVEFKTETGRATHGQRAWLAEISNCTPGDVGKRFRHFDPSGVLMAAIWRPSDWQEIEKVLH